MPPPPDFQTFQNPGCSVPRGFPSSILSVSAQGHLKKEVCYIVAAYTRTSVNMDRTLKFKNYKVGGTQNPLALLKPNIF